MKANITLRVGDYLVPDGWKVGDLLSADSGYKDSGFPGCQWRVHGTRCAVNGPPVDLAVNVTITGALRAHAGTFGCRCKIEFVGDCEPSTFSGGWIYPFKPFDRVNAGV